MFIRKRTTRIARGETRCRRYMGYCFSINSKISFICIISQIRQHMRRPLLCQSWRTGWNIIFFFIVQIVEKLVRLLPEGQQVKREVDLVLDILFETMSTTLFHLREVIFVTYNKVRVTICTLLYTSSVLFVTYKVMVTSCTLLYSNSVY